jgi:hypothetical protein
MGRSEQNGTTRRALLAFCVSLALLALALTGCGESVTQKQTDQYADGLCTDILGWSSRVETIAATLQVGAPGEAARSKLIQAKATTLELVRQIHSLTLPATTGAQQAKQNVDSFVGQAISTAGSIQLGVRQIESYGTDASNVATVALPIGLHLTELVQTGKATVTSLKSVKGPFDAAVKKSKACGQLTGSQT